MQPERIETKIYEIRGMKVMLDYDLAALYGVETRVLNQAIKRNIESFPEDFMFQLKAKKWETMSSQFVMTYPIKRPKSSLPYVFTEHGVTMLASVLKSSIARKMNIAIVRAFIALRKYVLDYNDLAKQIEELRDNLGEHDIQLTMIYDTIENLLETKQGKENERKRIGYK